MDNGIKIHLTHRAMNQNVFFPKGVYLGCLHTTADFHINSDWCIFQTYHNMHPHFMNVTKKQVLKCMYPTSASTPSLYGLPKTHKPGNPMRPIISAVGSFNHEAAKWLSNIQAALRHHSTIVRDTFSFVKEIQKNDLRGCVMASFDVKSLFTNIPWKFTTNLIVKSLFHDGYTQF